MRAHDFTIDVTDAVGLGESAHIALTVTLPEPEHLQAAPIVCFAKPGGGYSRGYYTAELPGPAEGAQAAWHAARGWIFVSLDHLGVGASSTQHSPAAYTFTNLAAASEAAEREVSRRLADGTLVAGYPAIVDPVVIGIGQSMGGCLTVVQQGRYDCYDGIGVLGFSAVHTSPPTPPGTPEIVVPWIPRDVTPTEWRQPNPLQDPGVVNKSKLADAKLTTGDAAAGPAMAWGFHYDDVDPAILAADLIDFPARNGKLPPWASATVPAVAAVWCIVPGAIAPEAAAVTVPVLVAMGERDVCADPKSEPRAYAAATSVDLFRCPRMGHMHNFAGTRTLFWQRIEQWANWVRVQKGLT
ncbi:MAG: hypothetical protein JWN96_3226 [Mycobacterium sp.]|nr:hypothetical protein [Mycobacterium sp.]